MSNSNNYRPIAIATITSKVLIYETRNEHKFIIKIKQNKTKKCPQYVTTSDTNNLAEERSKKRRNQRKTITSLDMYKPVQNLVAEERSFSWTQATVKQICCGTMFMTINKALGHNVSN